MPPEDEEHTRRMDLPPWAILAGRVLGALLAATAAGLGVWQHVQDRIYSLRADVQAIEYRVRAVEERLRETRHRDAPRECPDHDAQ